MLKLMLVIEKKEKLLVDMETGEIYAEGNELINEFLKMNENNYTLQLW